MSGKDNKKFTKLMDGIELLHSEQLQLMRLILNAVLPMEVANTTVKQIEELWTKAYNEWRKDWD